MPMQLSTVQLKACQNCAKGAITLRDNRRAHLSLWHFGAGHTREHVIDAALHQLTSAGRLCGGDGRERGEEKDGADS
jgi:hypothetical protein